jgi:hypothetical protein
MASAGCSGALSLAIAIVVVIAAADNAKVTIRRTTSDFVSE